MPTMRDSSGKESKTLSFVTAAYLALLGKFIIAGVNIPYLGVMPDMTAAEFGSAVAMVLAIWLGREWKETHYGRDRDEHAR